MSYYTRRPKFVVSKKSSIWCAWWVEFEALLMSFIMGYIMYTILAEKHIPWVYILAFTLTQFIRLLLALEALALERLDIDIEHPITVLAMATTTALLTTAIVSTAYIL